MSRHRRRLAGLLALLAGSSACLADGSAQLVGARQVVRLDLVGGLPADWRACAVDCDAAAPHQAMAFLRAGAGGGRLAWSVPGDPAAGQALAALRYAAAVDDDGNGPAAVLTSVEPWQGARLVHRYRLRPDGAGLIADLELPAGATLRFNSGDDLVPEQLPGLGAWYATVRSVVVSPAGQSEPGAGLAAAEALALPAGDWAGVRSRFWAFLWQADRELPTRLESPGATRPAAAFGEPSPDARRWQFNVYAGPVEHATLRAVARELDGLLFAALWDWLRALSFGLLAMLGAWQGVVGNWGVAIILLSASVKLLMWPLTRLAERWQADVNRIQSRLQPELAAIKVAYRGEEAHERTLAAYRQHGVSPYYTLKSLAGVLIQIPVFIAAFDMLGENYGLAGMAFLWIGDLALPDRLVALPVAVPFFGSHLNLLPVLMTAGTVLAARLQEDPSLAPALRAGQRLRLYGLAALFFVLLYTFPAAMVLYWTTNNLLHLLRVMASRWRSPRSGVT